MILRPLQKIVFSILLTLLFQNCFSTVMGPVKIDLIGFDINSNSIFFTRTDWGEFDDGTDLYIYRITQDTIEIVSNWSSKYEYEKKRDQIIENNGLSNLSTIDTSTIPDFVMFAWESPVKYISKISQEETISCPFKISVFDKDYNYYQCSEKSGEPIILNYQINENSGLIFIKFQGDCFEGNYRETFIFYKSGEKPFSRKLVDRDIAPLDLYRVKKK